MYTRIQNSNAMTANPSMFTVSPSHILAIRNRHTLRHVIDLIDPHQPLRQLEHIIPQTDNNELCVLCALLDIPRDNRNLSPFISHQPTGSVIDIEEEDSHS